MSSLYNYERNGRRCLKLRGRGAAVRLIGIVGIGHELLLCTPNIVGRPFLDLWGDDLIILLCADATIIILVYTSVCLLYIRLNTMCTRGFGLNTQRIYAFNPLVEDYFYE